MRACTKNEFGVTRVFLDYLRLSSATTLAQQNPLTDGLDFMDHRVHTADVHEGTIVLINQLILF